jgi:hypothetical protein
VKFPDLIRASRPIRMIDPISLTREERVENKIVL